MGSYNLGLDALPVAWPLRSIRPTLMAFSRHASGPLVEYFTEPETATEQWRLQGYFETKRIVFVVHGFRSSSTEDNVVQLREAMIGEMDQTVIMVDWSGGADLRLWKYIIASSNTQTVGQWIGKYVSEIRRLFPNHQIWGIGHSLGAHILGRAGRDSGGFDRITGLDPAGPTFELMHIDQRLQATDAQYMVDVIHTDGFNVERYLHPSRIVPINHFGTLIPLGTHDFYVNYGTSLQPGEQGIAGSHSRAIELFTWSVTNPGKFTTNQVLDGTPAFDKPVVNTRTVHNSVEMGYYADRNGPNESSLMFYIATNSTVPWVPLVGLPPPALRKQRYYCK